MERSLNLSASCNPCELNTVADAYPNLYVDHADIRFSPTEFLHVSTAAFGSFHTNVLKAIDPHNMCLISFPASIVLGRSAGVNAFAHPWPATSWAFPPACLFATALAYEKSTHARVAFVCHILAIIITLVAEPCGKCWLTFCS
jgi:hypothetical protein